jgi:hypothetical protein
LTPGKIPYGFKPLSIGRLDGDKSEIEQAEESTCCKKENGSKEPTKTGG